MTDDIVQWLRAENGTLRAIVTDLAAFMTLDRDPPVIHTLVARAREAIKETP